MGNNIPLLLALPRSPEVQAPIFLAIGVLLNISAFVYVWGSTYLQELVLFNDLISFTILFYAAQISSYIFLYFATRRIAAGGKFHYKEIPNAAEKTVVITGGNTGIGYATALNFAKWGFRVVVLCRDEKKGGEAIESLKRKSGNHSIEFYRLDLASFDSIREFAEIWHQQKDKKKVTIDILINNAGVMMCPFLLTKEGYEMQFGTNHLGHFLLTKLLLDCVIKTKGRIVNVSSFAHFTGEVVNTVDWSSLTEKYKSKYNSPVAYGNSKAANILFTRQLQKLYGDSGIKAYALHPGAVHTELLRHFNIFSRLIALPLQKLIFKTPNEGCQTTLHCALSSDAIPGEYYADCKVGPQLSNLRNPNEWERLWVFSEQAVAK